MACTLLVALSFVSQRPALTFRIKSRVYQLFEVGELTLLGPQSRFGGTLLIIRVFVPTDGSAVLKGLRTGCWISLYTLPQGDTCLWPG